MPIHNDNYEDLILDPAAIETHQQALEVMQYIEDEIANIEAQIQRSGMTGHQDREWLKKATFVLARKRRNYWSIQTRDKEIRGITKSQNFVEDEENKRLKREAELVRQQRLLIEAENARTDKRIKLEKILVDKMNLSQKARETKLKLFEHYQKLEDK